MFGDLAETPFDPQELQRRANRNTVSISYESVDYRLVREEQAGEGSSSTCDEVLGAEFPAARARVSRATTMGARAQTRRVRSSITDLNRLDGEWLSQAAAG